MSPETIEAGATVVLALTTLFSVYALGRQTRDAARTSSLEFYADTIASRKRRGGLPPDRDGEAIHAVITLAVPDAGTVEDPNLCDEIHSYLGYWEIVGVGVRRGSLDEQFLRAIAGGRVTHIAHNYLEFIARERERLHAPKLYESLTWLADRWDSAAT
jgi:hypothetical protein